MATADELLAMTAAEPITESADEILVADLVTRVISIPATLRLLGVESDDDVKRLQFKIPRNYGEFDLSTFDFRINFENARGKGDFYPVDDLTVGNDGYLTFSWLIDRVAFAYAGDVKFSICMKLYDGEVVVKELNTTYAILPVLEGLETEKAVVDQNPSAFDHVMARLYAVEAATGNGQNGNYSLISVDENSDGILFTIKDASGELVKEVRHGTDGVNGYTPQKGVDYWTSADEAGIKQEVVDYTRSELISWAPRSVQVVLDASGWSGNTQSVTVEGVTASNIVVVAPEPSLANFKEYAERNIRCVSQSDGRLTFECVTTPSMNLNVIVVVHYSGTVVEDGKAFHVSDDGNGNVTIIG